MEYKPKYNFKDFEARKSFVLKERENSEFFLIINLLAYDDSNMCTVMRVINGRIEKFGYSEAAKKGQWPWSKWEIEDYFEGIYWKIENVNFNKLVLYVEEIRIQKYAVYLLYGKEEYKIGVEGENRQQENLISNVNTFWGDYFVGLIEYLIEKGSKFCLPKTLIKDLELSDLPGFDNHFDNIFDANSFTESYQEPSANIELEIIDSREVNTSVDLSEYLLKAIAEFIVDRQAVATSVIQKHFNMSYDTAIDYVDKLQEMKIIGEFLGSEPRKVYVKNKDQLKNYFK